MVYGAGIGMSKDWLLLECEICSKVASWMNKDGIFCDRCKEDWPDD